MRFRHSVFLLAAASVSAVPLESRAGTSNITVINHDAVVGFPQTVPSSAIGTTYVRFKPWLYVYNGCVPYPAVDAAGDVSGGLDTTGSPEGDCTSSTGQVYVRGGWYGSQYGVMYSWFMPKDEPSDGLGHRYDWECSVVWVDDPTKAAPTVVGLSASAHGGFNTIKSDFTTHFSGTRPLIEYISYWPLDHQLIISTTQGGEQPLIAWESLTSAAIYTLTNYDFGDANVPFKDANFDSNLEKAWNA